MNKQYSILLAVVVVVTSFGSSLYGDTVAAQKDNGAGMMIDQLQAFQPFIGKTWKGTLQDSNTGKTMIDISRWERALNGQAVRILHSLNNGEYGGETIVVWDAKKNNLVFFYFTTAGFYTQGTITFEDGKYITHEAVTGNKNGITEVRSIGELLPDGRMHSRAEYFQDGKWVKGHEVFYVEAASAEVLFK